MNEYLVVYTYEDGRQSEEHHWASSLTEFKHLVKAMTEMNEGVEFLIYQMIPVHTDWAEQWAEEANAS